MMSVVQEKTGDVCVLSVIPARGGSKGIPCKNLALLVGKPLLAYSIESVLIARLVSRTIVPTEDAEIGRVALQWGAEVVSRPPELATDKNTHCDLALAEFLLNRSFHV